MDLLPPLFSSGHTRESMVSILKLLLLLGESRAKVDNCCAGIIQES